MKKLPPLSLEAAQIEFGIYEHYKGNRYQVLHIARNSETLEEWVVYKSISQNREEEREEVWARPLSMFLESVNGVPRFRHIK